MLVRALRLGWYGKRRRRPGDEFEIEGVHELGTWMERVNKPGPKKKTQGTEGGGQPPQSHGDIDVPTVKAGASRLE